MISLGHLVIEYIGKKKKGGEREEKTKGGNNIQNRKRARK
jgi:hypothetical protein